jgi:hypothetical protein
MPFSGTGTGIQNANDVFFSGLSRGHTFSYNTTTAKWNNAPTSVVYVKDYGAKGDGVTDDAAAIQSAVNAAAATSSEVWFHAGTYAVGSLLTVTAPLVGNNAKLVAVTASTSRTKMITAAASIRDIQLQATGAVISSYMLEISANASNVRIEKVTFTCDGANENERVQGIETRDNTSNILIRDCIFNGQTTAVRINLNTVGVLIEGCVFWDWEDAAIYVFGTTTSNVEDVGILGNRILPHRTRMVDLDSGAPVVLGPDPNQVKQPIRVEGADTRKHESIIIAHNEVICLGTGNADPTTPGSADAISVHRTVGLVVQGNTVIGSGDVGITVAQQCVHVVVANNIIRESDSVGICIGSSDSDDTRSVSVTGNTSVNNNQNRQNDNVARAKAGVLVNKCLGVVIDGNNLGDTQSTHTQVNAISVVDSQDVTIGAYVSRGNTGADIYFQGVNARVQQVNLSTLVP